MVLSDPNSAAERVADTFADRVMRSPAHSPIDSGESSRNAAGPTSRLSPEVASEIASERRHGQAKRLPAGTREFFEPRLGTDLGGVRIHTGHRADSLTRALEARAITVGQDIMFSGGSWSPNNHAGQRLLAHELAHIRQHNQDNGVVFRQEAGSQSNSGSSPVQIYETVPRPPGLSLDSGYVLEPLDLPGEVIAQMPEGQPIDVASLGLSTLGALGGSGGGWLYSTGASLAQTGFAAAGDTAIGIVAFPNADKANLAPKNMSRGRPLIPQSRMLWGHTAIYARQGGRITVLRSFGPKSILWAGAKDVLTGGGVRTGLTDVAGAWYHGGSTPTRGIPMWTNTHAMSLEYPVTSQSMTKLVNSMPDVGPSPVRYSGNPACGSPNCILRALDIAEDLIQGPIGPSTPEGPVSFKDLPRKGDTPVKGASSQGRLIQTLKSANKVAEVGGDIGSVIHVGDELAIAGAPVVGEMTTKMKLMRWGGRVFLVFGVASVPVEIYFAPEKEKERTAVGATSGFVGGLAAGAVAGLVCGPGALVCSIVLGIGFGIAGGLLSRAIAEDVYDIATGRIPSSGTGTTIQGSVVCPSCHALQREDAAAIGVDLSSPTVPDPGSSLLYEFGSPAQHQISQQEMDALLHWLGSE